MKENNKIKTKEFLKNLFKFWILVMGVFILLNMITIVLQGEQGGFIEDITGVIFMFGVCGIPIIMFFTFAISFAEKMVDKIPEKNKK